MIFLSSLVHDGAVATILDAAMAICSHTAGGSVANLTANLNIEYLRYSDSINLP